MVKDQKAVRTISRRAVLKTTGLAAGTLLAAPLIGAPGVAGARPASDAKGTLPSGYSAKIGVLLPELVIYPKLGPNFLAGMQTYIDGLGAMGGVPAGRKITLVPQDTGVGPSLTKKKAAKLLAAERVNLLTGVMVPSVAESLHTLLQASGAVLLAANTGENVPRTGGLSPNIFYHTLGAWQAARALGMSVVGLPLGTWAVAGKLGRKVFIATALYDAGYDSLYAFRLGVESAGGEVVETHVTHMPSGESGLDALIERIEAVAPDVVYGAYCGPDAMEFVRAYARSGLSRRIPLAGSAFMTDESILPEMGESALGIKTCFSWAADLDTGENMAFTEAYRKQTGEAPDAFALLGYETAQLAVQALDATAGDDHQVAQLRAALEAARIDGPRGSITMNPRTQETAGPAYLREVKREGKTLRNEVVEAVEPADENDPRIQELRASIKTGWLNAYMAV